MNLVKKLEKRRDEVNGCLCIGIDPDEEDIRKFMKDEKENGYINIKNNLAEGSINVVKNKKEVLCEMFDNLKEEDELFYFFNHLCFYIINITKKYTLAYKMNFAFYISHGSIGIDVLKNVFDYLYNINIPTVLDIKINDIGNTVKNYRKFIFEYLKSDACTVNTYMGTDMLKDICFDEIKKQYYSVFVLIKTTNPGSSIFQNKLCSDNKQFYLVMAEEVQKMSKELQMKENNAFAGFVVGSNSFEEMGVIREQFPDCYILSPGVGAQKGDLYKTLNKGYSKNYEKILINVGRGITKNPNPQQAAETYYNQIIQIIEEIKK